MKMFERLTTYFRLVFIMLTFFFLNFLRQGAGNGRYQRVDEERSGHKESRPIAAPNANAELVMAVQVIPNEVSFQSSIFYSW